MAESMFPDPRVDANEYLEAHKVKPLFQELGTRLMFDRPADPNAYLLEQLTQLQKLQNAGKPVLFFTEADIGTMFDMFDPTGRGDIKIEQYKQARNRAYFGGDWGSLTRAHAPRRRCCRLVSSTRRCP